MVLIYLERFCNVLMKQVFSFHTLVTFTLFLMNLQNIKNSRLHSNHRQSKTTIYNKKNSNQLNKIFIIIIYLLDAGQLQYHKMTIKTLLQRLTNFNYPIYITYTYIYIYIYIYIYLIYIIYISQIPYIYIYMLHEHQNESYVSRYAFCVKPYKYLISESEQPFTFSNGVHGKWCKLAFVLY